VLTYEKSWRYIAPFAALMALLGAGNLLKLNPGYAYPLRTVLVTVVLVLCSRRLVKLKPSAALASVLVGLAVFAVWIGPDLLWPGYRSHWLFTNFLTGEAGGPKTAGTPVLFMIFRVAGSVLLVPIVEELFWRVWLMRWLVTPNFEKVPLGTYTAQAFWLSAVLFASEHGAFWGVGLAAGIIYNSWMIRTRSLADCILAHAATNGALAGYVLLTGRWEYWL
jgi:CAAX prenyl protease-like protein